MSVMILVLFAVLSGGNVDPATRHGKYSTPDLKYWQLCIYVLAMSLLALPGVVITNRYIIFFGNVYQLINAWSKVDHHTTQVTMAESRPCLPGITFSL